MPSAPTRIAIIGLDHWYSAIPHAHAVSKRSDTELAGICDPDLARARQVAAQVGSQPGEVPTTVRPEDFLEDPTIDVITSFTSTDRNPEICVAAAKAGKHIVSIKPMARTLDDANSVLRAVRDAGVVFMPAESRGRASAFARQLRAWVDEGHFGQPLTASFSMWAGLPSGWRGDNDPGWFTDRNRAPGGGWIDHSIYHIDLLRWLFGARVTGVRGTAGNLKYPDLPVEDYGVAVCEFDNGMVATIEDSWTAPSGGFRMQMSLVGTDAAVQQDSVSGRLSLSGALQPFGGWAHIASQDSHAEALDEFLATIRENADPLATVEDAWNNLAVCRAFYTAAASGTIVAPERLP